MNDAIKWAAKSMQFESAMMDAMHALEPFAEAISRADGELPDDIDAYHTLALAKARNLLKREHFDGALAAYNLCKGFDGDSSVPQAHFADVREAISGLERVGNGLSAMGLQCAAIDDAVQLLTLMDMQLREKLSDD